MEKVSLKNVSLKSKVVNAVFWLAATKMVGQTISWIITVYVARILSPDDYGLMGMAWVFTNFIMLFNELGIGAAIIHKKDLTEDDLSNIYWFILLVNVALYLLSFAAAPLIAVFYSEPRLTSIIRIISISFILYGLGSVSYYMLTRELSFDKRSQGEFLANLSGGVSTLLFVMNDFGVWSLVYGNMVLAVVRNVLFFIYYPWIPGFTFSFARIGGFVNFGFKVSVARILWYIYNNADYLIAGKLLGKTLLGYYSLAFRFASIPLEKIVSLVSQVSYPAFSKVQDDKELMERYFLKIVRFVGFVTFPLFSGIFLVADDAVYLFLTEKWAPIILPLKILCLVSTLRAINAINSPLVLAMGRPGLNVFNNLIFALVLPVAFYIGSFYGLEGFSYSWLFAFPVVFLITTSISINLIGLSIFRYFLDMKHLILSTVIMTITVALVLSNFFSVATHLMRILVAVISGAASYLLYHSLFNRAIFSEIRQVVKR